MVEGAGAGGGALRTADPRVYLATLAGWFMSMDTVLTKHVGKDKTGRPHSASILFVPVYTIFYASYVMLAMYIVYVDGLERELNSVGDYAARFESAMKRAFSFCRDPAAMGAMVAALAGGLLANAVIGIAVAWYSRYQPAKVIRNRTMAYGYLCIAVFAIALTIAGAPRAQAPPA